VVLRVILIFISGSILCVIGLSILLTDLALSLLSFSEFLLGLSDVAVNLIPLVFLLLPLFGISNLLLLDRCGALSLSVLHKAVNLAVVVGRGERVEQVVDEFATGSLRCVALLLVHPDNAVEALGHRLLRLRRRVLDTLREAVVDLLTHPLEASGRRLDLEDLLSRLNKAVRHVGGLLGRQMSGPTDALGHTNADELTNPAEDSRRRLNLEVDLGCGSDRLSHGLSRGNGLACGGANALGHAGANLTSGFDPIAALLLGSFGTSDCEETTLVLGIRRLIPDSDTELVAKLSSGALESRPLALDGVRNRVNGSRDVVRRSTDTVGKVSAEGFLQVLADFIEGARIEVRKIANTVLERTDTVAEVLHCLGGTSDVFVSELAKLLGELTHGHAVDKAGERVSDGELVHDILKRLESSVLEFLNSLAGLLQSGSEAFERFHELLRGVANDPHGSGNRQRNDSDGACKSH